MANYNRAMKKAPRNRQLLLLVPNGDRKDPLAIEIGWWEAKLKRWEGDWRYDESKGNWAEAEPIGWAALPEIDIGLAELTIEVKVSAAALEPSNKSLDDTTHEALPATVAGKRHGVDMTTDKVVPSAKAKRARSGAIPKQLSPT